MASVLPLLANASSEIRLLQVHPGAGDSPIECTFEIADLDDAHTKYETVSYVWGDPEEPGSEQTRVLIGGSPVRVGRSAHEVLRRMRKADEVRVIWIDALCINQSDTAEKTSQVAMMGRVYKSCTQCAVFLGGEGVDAKLAFEVIRWIGRDAPRPSWVDDPALRARAVAAFMSAMEAPWWNRIWTVQEALFPRALTVHWGDSSIPFSLLYRASSLFNTDVSDDESGDEPSSEQDSNDDDEYYDDYSDDEINFEMSTAFTQSDIEKPWQDAVYHLKSRLQGLIASRDEGSLHLLWRWRYRQSTDPRDKVYGLLGFRKDLALPSAAACDYSVDARTLFARVSVDLIRAEGDLHALIGRRGSPHHHHHNHLVAGLPSWAVDWTAQPRGGGREDDRSSFWDHEQVWTCGLACADRGVRGVGDGLETVDEPVPGKDGVTRPRALILSGVYVDRVALVGSEEPPAAKHMDEVSWMMSESPRWSQLIKAFEERYPGRLRPDWMRALVGLATGRIFFENREDTNDSTRDQQGTPRPMAKAGTQYWPERMLGKQAIFVTEGGYLGLGPYNAAPGQEVWIVGGSRFPLLLEEKQISQQGEKDQAANQLNYSFVSEVFVYGIMNGEAVKGPEEEHSKIRLY